MQVISKKDLLKTFYPLTHSFTYDLGIKIILSPQDSAGVMICCHGYGHNREIASVVQGSKAVNEHIIAFNFPDYDLGNGEYDPKTSTFGSINELLPLLYVIKKCVIDAGLSKIDLYGFSAGGGAVINALAVLNQDRYDKELETIGITADNKNLILKAIEQGLILLECPLKSVDEILVLHGQTPEFTVLAERYSKNNLRPIDSILKLEDLTLTILLYFEKGDDVLGNRDDDLFIERLKKVNKGKTEAVKGSFGGHNAYHLTLWTKYKSLKSK